MEDQSPAGSPDDTILAVSTPPGVGSLAMIRLSGPQAIFRLCRVAADGGQALAKAPGSTGLRVLLRAGPVEVPSWVQIYRAPRSYTREDMAEVHVPGALPLIRLVTRVLTAPGSDPRAADLRAVVRGGRVRWARAGEFTLRAVLNGRIDLARAEAVAALIAASGESEALAARRGLRGELGDAVRGLLGGLVELLALLEAGLDFPDEEFPDLAPESVRERIGALLEAQARLRGSVALRVPTDDCLRVVLAGFPNAGKSSLLNALLGRRAAITSDIPGTTRDPVRGLTQHEGRRIEWIDLAGARDVDWLTMGDATGDEASLSNLDSGDEDLEEERRILRIVRRLTRVELETADLVLWVVDAASQPEDSIRQFHRLGVSSKMLVFQKVDLLDREVLARLEARYEGALPVSAHDRTGLGRVVEGILVGGGRKARPQGAAGAAPRLLVSAHQEAALASADEALLRAREALDGGLGAECVVSDLRDALGALEEVAGVTPREAVLDWVFSHFCIGK